MKSKNTHINIRKKKKHMHSRKKTRRKVGSKAKITIRRKKTRRKVKSKKTRIRRNKNMRSIYKKRMNKKYRGGGWREWWVRKRSPLSRNTHSRSPSYLYRAAPTNYFSHDGGEFSNRIGFNILLFFALFMILYSILFGKIKINTRYYCAFVL